MSQISKYAKYINVTYSGNMKAPNYSSDISLNPKYRNIMTILVAEKDCILQGLSLSSLWTWLLYHTEGLHPPCYPITATVIRKEIKVTHCIRFIFGNEHNFTQNYAMVNQKYPPKLYHTFLLFAVMLPSFVCQSITFILTTLPTLTPRWYLKLNMETYRRTSIHSIHICTNSNCNKNICK